ncbi:MULTISPECIES: LysE family translocator [Pseudomonas]|uniref:Lysine transporter LysE n=1 Tax=Pseudomonas putida TaxID=303 RepID=A0A1L7NB41_PSEPU|nr:MULTISPECIES: LysE family translocator [Pseudomonas]MBP2084012.1 threonine/homoserine/homoserine lactone efflux protein [Pseudomonas sp. PvP089]MBP2090286.1 threonine/homoserine/homoserine lactone efflux protein [Pseudomonas sp. PvP088]MBP2223550.1 threonine/homoserine/homoserine lactone efflux protein [Pseudomonas putida]MDO1495642.1 LysE family translocator [Pseudomonas putida]PMY79996.1 LysE family translocator [Pseudomonas sp. FW306-2-2C-D06B]
MSQSLLPFILFALVASISPGPTNLLILAHGARVGLRASLVPIVAACGAAAAIVLMVGLGLGELLLRHPLAQQLMSWAGVLWLSWLAWKMLRSAATPLQAATAQGLSAFSAASLQVVNPKVWLMAVAVVGVFAAPSLPVWQLALVFLLIALPCMAAWAVLGVGSARWLQAPRRLQLFNQVLAGVLLISAWAAVLA